MAKIALRVDHTVESEVRELFQRVERERGRLDVVADSVAGEDPSMAGWSSFWETDLTRGEEALRQALLSHLITAKHAAASMVEHGRGLILQVTDGDMFGNGGNLLSGTVKTALPLLAFRMAGELRSKGVASMCITPGFLRSETMLEHFGVTEDTWRDAGKQDENFLESETPLFVGRAVAALAGDPDLLARSGQLTSSWEVAREFGFSDADGGRPDWGEHFETIAPEMPMFQEGLPRLIAYLEQIEGRARRYLGIGAEVAQRP